MRLYRERQTGDIAICISQRVEYKGERMTILCKVIECDFRLLPTKDFIEGFEHLAPEDLTGEEVMDLKDWERALHNSLMFVSNRYVAYRDLT